MPGSVLQHLPEFPDDGSFPVFEGNLPEEYSAKHAEERALDLDLIGVSDARSFRHFLHREHFVLYPK